MYKIVTSVRSRRPGRKDLAQKWSWEGSQCSHLIDLTPARVKLLLDDTAAKFLASQAHFDIRI